MSNSLPGVTPELIERTRRDAVAARAKAYKERREDFALETFKVLLAANPSKTYESLASRALTAADALIAELDKQP